jgi:spore coat protein A, manganese oxidase
MKNFLLIVVCFFALKLQAQTPLLDAVAHPKYQNLVPIPAKINLSSTTTNVLEMAQRTQWLGLVGANNTPLPSQVFGFGLAGLPSYPGPTLVANSGVPVNVEWRNNLPVTHLVPIDTTYHLHLPRIGIPTVVHLHGGHTEAVSDGNPDAWYSANYAEKGTAWTKSVYTYENSQEAATLWYHDHVLGMTRLNVYAGLVGTYLLNDANDQAVSLPRGAYDRELVLQDKMFDTNGQMFYPSDPPAGTTAVAPSGLPEFFGDFILVNGMVWPYMNVEPRKYRFRLINGSDSRVYTFALSNFAPFMQIATDDGKLNTPSVKNQLDLAPGERAEVIVDFSSSIGQTITLLNSGPDGPFGNPASPTADPLTTGQIMQFRVNLPKNNAIAEATVNPATNLRPNLGAIPTMGAATVTRKLALSEGLDDLGRIMPMLGIIDPTNPTDGSQLWHMPVTETPLLNDTEIWEIYNTTADAHPIHLHLNPFQVLSRQSFTATITPKPITQHDGAIGEGSVVSNIVLTGVPTNFTAADEGLKDTYVMYPDEVVRIKVRFDKTGDYVWHCHILSHEDHDMMRKIRVGTTAPTGNLCANPAANVVPSANSITVNGISTSSAIIQVLNNSFTTVYNQQVSTTSATIPNLTAGTYTLNITILNTGGIWPAVCTKQQVVTVGGGNTNPCATDLIAPVLTPCPANLNLTTTGTTANPSWTAPTATDNCTTPSVSFTTSPTAGLTNGGAFPIGTTTVNYKATDGNNNSATCSFAVNVTFQNTGGGSDICANPTANIVGGSNTITVSGVTTASAVIQLFTSAWSPVYNQQVSANSTTIPNLAAGTYNIKVTVLGAGGVWPAICNVQQTVTVGGTGTTCANDATPPVFSSCPTSFSVIASGSTGYPTWIPAVATDNCTTPTLVYNTSPTVSLINGGAFPLGTTNVVYTATDARGNVANCNFAVTINSNNPCANDLVPPVIAACPTNFTISTTANVGYPSWTPPSISDNCTPPSSYYSTSPTTNLINGNAFPIGATTVTYTATDAKNNRSTCSFIVTVLKYDPCATDVTPPVISACPTNFSVTATTATSGVPTWTAPIITDNCSTPSVYYSTSPTTNLINGSAFPIGTTNVIYTATDAKNNRANCNFTVTVLANPCASDATPPVLTACPANVTVTTTGTTGVTSWTPPTATDNCGTATVSFTTSPTANLTNGAAFPKGQSTVTYKATDAKNNVSTCAFTVMVTEPCSKDVTPPTISACPSNMTLATTGTTAIASWAAPIIIDNCGTYSVALTTSPTKQLVSGNAFPTGTTTVTYTATDAKSNKSTCTFTVYVYRSATVPLAQSNYLTMNAAAEPTRAFIEWVNNTGFKNDYFTVEKISKTTGLFEQLEVVNNTSKDDAVTHYATYDNVPTEGDNIYRVKLTHQDGSVVFSESKVLNFSNLNVIRVFPNPVNDVLTVDLSSYKNQEVTVYLYNYLGQEMVFQKANSQLNNGLLDLNVAQQQTGNYRLRVTAKGRRDVVQSVMIAH